MTVRKLISALALSVLLALSINTPARAARPLPTFGTNGERLLAICSSDVQADDHWCRGFIKGAVQAYISTEVYEGKCVHRIPGGVTEGEFRDMVVDYLKANRKYHDVTAALLVFFVLENNFRCD